MPRWARPAWQLPSIRLGRSPVEFFEGERLKHKVDGLVWTEP